MASHLLNSRRFLPLLLTQFLGALNDNFFKTSVVMLATYRLAALSHTTPHLLVILAGALYITPYILFCAIGGRLADKFDKAAMARVIKLAEVAFMLLAALGFYYHLWVLLFVVLFCMGAHSAFFSPPKYALMPEQLHADELLEGNAFIESGTFIATLLGTIAGGPLVLKAHGEVLVSACVIIIALLGVVTSRFIPPSTVRDAAAKLSFNPFSETLAGVAFMRRHPPLFKVSLVNSWFYFVAITFAMLLAPYALAIGANEDVGTLLLTAFTVGIGVGTIASGALIKGNVTRTVPASALGMSLFIFDFWRVSPAAALPGQALMGLHPFLAATPDVWHMLADLFMIAACGGFFIVPLYATLQRLSPPVHRAQVMACNNVLNAFFMVGSAVMALVLYVMGIGIGGVFAATGIANAAMTVYLFLPSGRLEAPGKP